MKTVTVAASPRDLRKYRHPHQAENAKMLASIAGTGAGARYLRYFGWSLEAALWILLGK